MFFAQEVVRGEPRANPRRRFTAATRNHSHLARTSNPSTGRKLEPNRKVQKKAGNRAVFDLGARGRWFKSSRPDHRTHWPFLLADGAAALVCLQVFLQAERCQLLYALLPHPHTAANQPVTLLEARSEFRSAQHGSEGNRRSLLRWLPSAALRLEAELSSAGWDASHRGPRAKAVYRRRDRGDVDQQHALGIAGLPTREQVLARLHPRSPVKLRTPVAAIIRTSA